MRATSLPTGKIKVGFNTMFTPKRMLMKFNAMLTSYLFYNRNLCFISSERNANFEWSGVREDEDYMLSSNGYPTLPFLFEVEVPAVMGMMEAIDKNPLGYFEFSYNGKTYKGYIADGTDSVQVNPMNETSSTLKLIAHKESGL